MNELCIKAGEVLADIRSAAWLESELHPELDRHRRHEMADICEADNVERVWRVLGVAVAEVRLSLIRILRRQRGVVAVNELQRPAVWRFRLLCPVPEAVVAFLREKVHEYMVAAVMADRCATIIPAAASVWQGRVAAALAALRNVALATPLAVAPVRRPLWPL